MQLSSKNIAELKRIAHSDKNLLKFNIGKENIDDNVIEMLKKAIFKHEIIKIAFLKSLVENCDINTLIEELASKLDAVIVQKIGHTAIFYKENTKLPNRIKLK